MIDSFSGPYRFLSNFYPSPFPLIGVTWPTVEHAYQFGKVDPKSIDLEKWKRIFLECITPREAKKLGQSIEIREDWEHIKVMVMRGLLGLKFNNPELRGRLLATGSQELVEGNNWNDTFWGVCRGVGQNYLGRLLMDLRDELRA